MNVYVGAGMVVVFVWCFQRNHVHTRKHPICHIVNEIVCCVVYFVTKVTEVFNVSRVIVCRFTVHTRKHLLCNNVNEIVCCVIVTDGH